METKSGVEMTVILRPNIDEKKFVENLKKVVGVLNVVGVFSDRLEKGFGKIIIVEIEQASLSSVLQQVRENSSEVKNCYMSTPT